MKPSPGLSPSLIALGEGRFCGMAHLALPPHMDRDTEAQRHAPASTH